MTVNQGQSLGQWRVERSATDALAAGDTIELVVADETSIAIAGTPPVSVPVSAIWTTVRTVSFNVHPDGDVLLRAVGSGAYQNAALMHSLVDGRGPAVAADTERVAFPEGWRPAEPTTAPTNNALPPPAPPPPPDKWATALEPIRIERYTGGSREEALRSFAEDSNRAGRVGYHSVAQTWDGDVLLVTYQRVAAPVQPTSTPQPRSPYAPQQTVVDLPIAAIAVIIGGAMVAVGSIMPWVTAVGPFGVTVNRAGVEGGDGLVTILVGILIALLGIPMINGASDRFRRIVIVESLIVLAIVVYDFFDIQKRIDAETSSAFYASQGIGIWIVALGAIVALVAAFKVPERQS